jgi:hypothetical protein
MHPPLFQATGNRSENQIWNRLEHLVKEIEFYLYLICMKSERESDKESGAKSYLQTDPKYNNITKYKVDIKHIFLGHKITTTAT